MSEKKENKSSELTDIGAFWKKTKNGKTFLSGKVKISDREFTAFIFTNNKSKPNQPDYRLTLSNLDEDLCPPSNNQNKPKAEKEPIDSGNQDDIPF